MKVPSKLVIYWFKRKTASSSFSKFKHNSDQPNHIPLPQLKSYEEIERKLMEVNFNSFNIRKPGIKIVWLQM